MVKEILADIPSTDGEPKKKFASQEGFRYRLEWGVEGTEALGNPDSLAIVIDVLSFSTAVDVALSHGAIIMPCRKTEPDLDKRARSMGASLSVKRNELGFSLSPRTMERATTGQKILLKSDNGATVTTHAAKRFGTVIAGCLRNASAVAKYVKGLGPKTICFIPSGERWPNGALRPALEDLIGAGAILSHLDVGLMSPEAKAALSAFKSTTDMRKTLWESASGRELRAAGYSHDVESACMVDKSATVPILKDGWYMNVSVIR